MEVLASALAPLSMLRHSIRPGRVASGEGHQPTEPMPRTTSKVRAHTSIVEGGSQPLDLGKEASSCVGEASSRAGRAVSAAEDGFAAEFILGG